MNQRTMFVANAALIAAALIIGIFLYPALPNDMVSHWDAAGKASGTMPKLWGVFLLPAIMVLILGLSVVLPIIDPMRHNVQAFRRSYQNLFFWIGVFLFYIFVLTVGWNLGWRFNFGVMLAPALAALWFVIGSLLERSKQNWFVGIRTPWTMESESVWDKTHHLGGILFKGSAAIVLIGTFFPAWLVYFILVPTIATVVVTVVYSYIEFKRERV